MLIPVRPSLGRERFIYAAAWVCGNDVFRKRPSQDGSRAFLDSIDAYGLRSRLSVLVLPGMDLTAHLAIKSQDVRLPDFLNLQMAESRVDVSLDHRR
jgi:hypothetical protein